MASIETYLADISRLKDQIEALKGGGGEHFFIEKMDGTRHKVECARDLDFRWGTVIASSTGTVYLSRADQNDEYWCASAGMGGHCTNEALFEKLRMEAEQGYRHGFLNETGLWGRAWVATP